MEKTLLAQFAHCALFLQLILNVHVNNRELWQFMFHEVYYNHDSQNSFSVYHDSRTPKMDDHGDPPPPPPFIVLVREREPQIVPRERLIEEDINRFAETMSQFFKELLANIFESNI